MLIRARVFLPTIINKSKGKRPKITCKMLLDTILRLDLRIQRNLTILWWLNIQIETVRVLRGSKWRQISPLNNKQALVASTSSKHPMSNKLYPWQPAELAFTNSKHSQIMAKIRMSNKLWTSDYILTSIIWITQAVEVVVAPFLTKTSVTGFWASNRYHLLPSNSISCSWLSRFWLTRQ